LYLLLEALDQLLIGGDQRLLGFDLSDDGLLGGEERESSLTVVMNRSSQRSYSIKSNSR
jgi:hypothetical protein